MTRPFVFATGGTGGHVLPAVALARRLDSKVVFMGSGLDTNAYIDADLGSVYPIASRALSSWKAPFTYARGIAASLLQLRRCAPKAVVGFGSYHSFPTLYAAFLLRIPIILFEPNAILGRVNRFFASKAHCILSQFPVHDKAVIVQLPSVHTEIIDKAAAKAHYGFAPDKEVVLVVGGSQGAGVFAQLTLPKDIQVLHISGKNSDPEALSRAYEVHGIPATVLPFEKNMAYAWSAADLAVCRSGALTISEHLYYKVPALFIPFPNASGQHQWHNACYVARAARGCLVLEQKDLSHFTKRFAELRGLSEVYRHNLTNYPLPSATAESVLERHHFIGVGGIGMSALAHMALEKGLTVSGSDTAPNANTKQLEDKGLVFNTPQRAERVMPFAQIVYSSAISKKNPERACARRLRLPQLHRSAFLAQLLERSNPLLVAGSHGKTSSSALLAHTVKTLGLDPSYCVGGILTGEGKGGGYGRGPFSVAEADESDGSFLEFTCHSAIITNIETEHMDHWKDDKHLAGAFKRFISKVKHHLVWCYDSPMLMDISPHGVSYGFSKEADVQIQNEGYSDGGSHWELHWQNGDRYTLHLPIIGKHAILNATGVFVLLDMLGFDRRHIMQTWTSYRGVARRLEHIGSIRSIDIYDDYAHHPTEIAATLEALRHKAGARRVVVAFQPHRYTRFQNFFQRFAQSLALSDSLFVTDIYAAGESPMKDVDPKELLLLLKQAHYASRDVLAREIAQSLQPGDIFITLGAGDITSVSKEVYQLLHERA